MLNHIDDFFKRDENVLILNCVYDSYYNIFDYLKKYKNIKFFIPYGRIAKYKLSKLSSADNDKILSLYQNIYEKVAKYDEVLNIEKHQLKKNDNLNNISIFVMFDAHLLSDSYEVFFDKIYGSGYILNDFIEYVGNKKIIFAGDPFCIQMGGVSEAGRENALNDNYLKIKYNLKTTKADTALNKKNILNQIKESINSNLYNNLHIKANENIVFLDKNNAKEIINNEVCKNKNHILVYSNERAKDYNIKIKNNILGKNKNLEVGDYIVFRNNIIAKKNKCKIRRSKI